MSNPESAPKWVVGQEVTTGPLAVPTTIARITPTGQFVTADGRRFLSDGRQVGASSRWRSDVMRPVRPEDAEIRKRDRRAREIANALDGVAKKVEELRASMSNIWRPFTPEQDAIDRAERFLAAVRGWENGS